MNGNIIIRRNYVQISLPLTRTLKHTTTQSTTDHLYPIPLRLPDTPAPTRRRPPCRILTEPPAARGRPRRLEVIASSAPVTAMAAPADTRCWHVSLLRELGLDIGWKRRWRWQCGISRGRLLCRRCGCRSSCCFFLRRQEAELPACVDLVVEHDVSTTAPDVCSDRGQCHGR